MSNSFYNYIFKIIIIGDPGVGKSNILLQFTEKEFQKIHDMTLGVEFGSKIISAGGKKYKLQIWDTAGQEAFKSITRSYYRGSIGCLLVYDVTNRTTFENIKNWLDDIKQYAPSNIVVTLIGNKIDLNQRKVTYEEGHEFAEKNKIGFFETSALDGTNINDTFIDISIRIQQSIDCGKIIISTGNNGAVKLGNINPIKIGGIGISSESGSCSC
jgi:Ras-related protein Rab-2A